MVRQIKKLFIANRGEIARRVAQSARKLGIKTVALSDRIHPPHFLLEAVDEIHFVEKESRDLYLNPDQLLSIAQKTGCDAVHPGFGFLSENSIFAQKVKDAGLVWIGPTAKTIDQMASKSEARKIAAAHDVPCTKGLNHLDLSKQGAFEELKDFCTKTPLPLLVKAAFGGGGKGMRIIEDIKDAEESCRRAHSEAIKSFASGLLIIEQYIGKSRHVEVQVLGDQHGNIHIIGDRDCSLQRRHQKIIEEAPAPFLTDDTRKAIHTAALKLAKAVDYVSAGTVEFLVDWSEEAQTKNQTPFYFLEMNTRLQVEHPVTEEVFGLDLVEWQLRVAQGEHLPKEFADLKPIGHALEARLYAEDPQNDFLPSPSPVYCFSYPKSKNLRWEIGVDPIDDISSDFDPMIAKLIAKGSSRAEAAAILNEGIKETFLLGPKHNLSFLSCILEDSPFKETVVTTDFLATHGKAVLELEAEKNLKAKKVVEAFLQHQTLEPSHLSEDLLDRLTKSSFQLLPSNNRLLFFAQREESFYHKDQNRSCIIHHGLLDRESLHMARVFHQGLLFDGMLYAGYSFLEPCSIEDELNEQGSIDDSGKLVAPVPGKVVKVERQEGDSLQEGDTVLVIESMKMEFHIKAKKAGVIEKIHVKKDDQITSGECLVVFLEDNRRQASVYR